ncbi:pentatricopeptide repeat-containing protein [Plectosphaerella plurivora]|uniref:Pentatricopeptide repeat-containing protein n=1 Tax=Plectosphaerella plurivora TaxID=936078 RepID=A0A9P8VKW4_9PEZI|nr:pentatricopeptide repeat-containing protein [Plectosphaerella plurivora]
MRALRGIDGSICGAILATRPPALAATATTGKPQHGEQLRVPRPARRSKTRKPREPSPLPSAAIHHCPRTSSWLLSTFLPEVPIPRSITCKRPFQFRPAHQQQARRYNHAATATSSVANPSIPRIRAKPEHLMSMVGKGEFGSVEEHLDLVRDPYMRRYARPDGPDLIVSDKRTDHNYPNEDEAIRGDPKVEELTRKMRLALVTRQRQPSRVPLQKIESLYKHLPQPRMLHLPATLRHRLLKAMGTPNKRDSTSMLRFFDLIEEVKNSGLMLNRREWNSALAFASKYVGSITDTETEMALQLWGEMERSGGQKANGVTFNILFDAAAKSGNFLLAEKIYDEMESRGLEFNRYHRVSLIYFFGLKEDADGVRAAYKEMVEAGEMIDTVALNCLIASLFRAGDPAAALRVWGQMMHHSSTTPTPPASKKLDKVISELLMMYSRVGRSHPELRSSFQEQTPVSPNLKTFQLVLYHWAWTVGDMGKVGVYLNYMQARNIPVCGSIFLILFKGFAKHGGGHYTSWTEARLKKVYASLLAALKNTDNTIEQVYLDTWLAGWTLRAFMKCAGPAAVHRVYDELQSCWKLNESEAAHMQDYLYEVLRGGSDQGVFTHEESRSRLRKPPRSHDM